MFFVFSKQRVVPLAQAPLRPGISIATGRRVKYLQKFHNKYEPEIKMICLNRNY